MNKNKKSYPYWDGKSWNPFAGCRKISDGCKNCWAETMANRLAHIPATAATYSKVISNGRWNGDFVFNPKALERRFKPDTIVPVQFMGDLFYRLTDWHISIIKKIEDNPETTFVILTKRPENAADFFGTWPREIPNLWLGVSIEDQKSADLRIPELLPIENVGKRILSIEPMLAPIDIMRWHYHIGHELDFKLPFDWVIVGGESGNNPRYMDADWVRYILCACQASGTPFWFKHMAGRQPIPDNIDIQERP
jgi:protein gp37